MNTDEGVIFLFAFIGKVEDIVTPKMLVALWARARGA